VTCDEVRDRLSEHALGMLEETDDLRIRRHLRGCAQCRREFASIGDGLAMFAAAAHDRPPPEELRERVLSTLAEEWRQDPVLVPDPARGRTRAWLVACAACLALAVVAVWGVSLRGDANAALADAASYQRLLDTLGGEEFRVAALEPSGTNRIDGSVVLYDSSVEQSWGVVLVRAPDLTGSVGATLASADGRTLELHDVELEDGRGATWLVTSADLHDFDRLTITGADGSRLATARITQA
jgi:anti-sigma factor RsiW